MNNKNILTGLVVFLIVACICPVLFAIVFVGLESIAGRETRDLATLLFFACCGGGLILLALGGLGRQLWYVFQSRKAGERLATALGLASLNQSAKQMAIWYGGERAGRRFALKPFGTPRHYFAMGRSRVGARFQLRILMEVRVTPPGEIDVYLDREKDAGEPGRFEEAFAGENVAWLTPEGRAAMFAFAQKGYATGLNLKKFSFRTAKGWRRLRLCDRAATGDDLSLPL